MAISNTPIPEELRKYDRYFQSNSFDIAYYDGDPVCVAIEASDTRYRKGEESIVLTKHFGNIIGNMTVMPMYCAFLDTNNNPGIDRYLVAKGLGEPYKRFGEYVGVDDGFGTTYPLFQFYKSELEKYAYQADKRMPFYEEAYAKGFRDVQRQMNIEMFGFDPLDEEKKMQEATKNGTKYERPKKQTKPASDEGPQQV
jgi:hypothetical protein